MIYLDHPATTPMDPRVREAMEPFLGASFGNPASTHVLGEKAAWAVEEARSRIAETLGAEPREIIFTSGATESDNLALKGVAKAHAGKTAHFITSAAEHPAVLDTCEFLIEAGFTVTALPVDSAGIIRRQDLVRAITPDTVLISIMAANNEVGTLSPLRDIGALAKEHGILFHCDATQAVGKVPLDVQECGIHLMSLSAHKIYGPKGIGLLYVRSRNPRVRMHPLHHGGGHERGLRSGTLNVPGIVGLARALEIAQSTLAEESARLVELRVRLLEGLQAQLEGIQINGDLERSVPGILNLSFADVDAEALMKRLPEICLSSGSACTTASREPSHVLLAMGRSKAEAAGSIRFGLGRGTTAEEIDQVVSQVVDQVKKLRVIAP